MLRRLIGKQEINLFLEKELIKFSKQNLLKTLVYLYLILT